MLVKSSSRAPAADRAAPLRCAPRAWKQPYHWASDFMQYLTLPSGHSTAGSFSVNYQTDDLGVLDLGGVFCARVKTSE